MDSTPRSACDATPAVSPDGSGSRRGPACVLIVDDVEQNVRLLSDLLSVKCGYRTEHAFSGEAALAQAERLQPDLILLDVVMPGMDGFEVCRRLRSRSAFEATPIVLVTSLDPMQERINGLEAGADDFLSKPLVQAELFARVRSLLRVKSLYDQVTSQRNELAQWSLTLEQRVRDKLDEIERLARLKRFFSPRLAAKLLGDGRDDLLQSRRREVSVLFADLRGFTAFADTEPADTVMGVLREFHTAMGELIFRFDGTLERFTGDGMMVFFNDPDPTPEHALHAVKLGLAMCDAAAGLEPCWAARHGPRGVGIGIAKGIATVGAIGFESRLDYAAIGTVTNLATRLCAEAQAGEVLVSREIWADVEGRGYAAQANDLVLKGFAQPVRCYRMGSRP